jgi:hypothetical protein
VTYLHRNRFGTSVHVRRSETEQAKSGADKAILAAVVFHHPIPVIAAVEFNSQTLNAVKEVRPAQESPPIIVDGNLNFRSGKSGENEEHSKPCLHRRLSLWLSQLHSTPQSSDPFGSWMLGDMTAQVGH